MTKLRNSFVYDVIINGIVVGKYNGAYRYGQDKTIYDSTIEVDFVPEPTINSIEGIRTPEDYIYSFKENKKDDEEKQIHDLFNRLIKQFIITKTGISITKEEKRTTYITYVPMPDKIVEIFITHEKNLENKKLVCINSTGECLKYDINTSDKKIISDIYDLIK